MGKIPQNERFSSRKLVDDLTTQGLEAHYFPETSLSSWRQLLNVSASKGLIPSVIT
jgi:hypothetical protein